MPSLPSRRTYHPSGTFRGALQALFNLPFLGTGGRETRESSWPYTDITEEKEHYVILADLPGVRKEDIKVAVEANRLSISGERKQTSRQEEGGYRHEECCHGSFYRSFALPDSVDTDTIDAAYTNGVLELRLMKIAVPKREVKQIPIGG